MPTDIIEAIDQTGRAVEATANAVSKAVDGAAALLKAPIIKALAGLAGGNYIIELNERQRFRLKAKTAEYLAQDGVKDDEVQEVSGTISIPLVAAAENESRPDLQDLWARLLATAMNPSRSHEVRIDFIETLKQLDPIDVRILKGRNDNVQGGGGANTMQLLRVVVHGVDDDDLVVSIRKLERLGCFFFVNAGVDSAIVTPYGRKLIAACSSR